jgi:hypothetical protein
MVTILNFKDLVDLPKWRPLATPLATPNTNFNLISDLRNNEDRHPFIYWHTNPGGVLKLHAYSTKNDEWIDIRNTAMATQVVEGLIMPAQGPRGTIAAGATTTTLALTTVLPATVGINQLANRGDGRGFKIRIIGNAAGSSGKTEERLVIANTSGTTPTITLDSALSFVPILGDAYEFLSGRVFLLGTSNAAGSWKYYDILTNSMSGNLATANLPASWSDANLVGLDELLVPYDRNPGEGFFNILTATASAAASLTGQAVGGDAGVVANQYRNFQIRIVQDVAIPTAVGQRRNITSHTAGPSPVYTVPVWTVTPSATASYVIENNGDRIIAWLIGTTQTSTYTIAGNAWDANITFAVRPTIPGSAFMSFQAFAIEPDTASPPNARQSFIFAFRGGGSVLDLFDIAGAATGLWTTAITYGNSSNTTFTIVGTSATVNPATNEGRYMYINQNLTNRFLRFDMKNRILEPMTFLRVPTITTSQNAFKKLAYSVFVDGSTKLSFLYFIDTNLASGSIPQFYGLPITR